MPRRVAPLTAAQRQQIEALRSEGMSFARVLQHLDLQMSESTLKSMMSPKVRDEPIEVSVSGEWSPAEAQRLTELMLQKKSHLEIAQALGRSVASVRAMCAKRGLAAYKIRSLESCDDSTAATLKERKCLSCRVSFISEHAGHRICDGCKSDETWRFGATLSRAGVIR